MCLFDPLCLDRVGYYYRMEFEFIMKDKMVRLSRIISS